jgi:PAS domain S-box-containing protein
MIGFVVSALRHRSARRGGRRPALRKSPRAARLTRYWGILPWIVVAIGIPTAVVLYSTIENAVESVARLRFERQAADAKAIIESRLAFYEDILHSLKALFASQGPVTRAQFHAFAQSLDLKKRYPGFDLVNFATYVPGERKAQFEESVRKDTSVDPRGYPDFRVKPPGDRDEYFVIVYLEPMEGFEFAFGLDMGANPDVSDPHTVAATQRAARDSGKLSASGLPIRVRTPKEYIGLAMRMPVYRADMPQSTIEERRAAYVGSVGAGFNVDNLMRGILDRETTRYMRFRLYDVGPADDAVAAASAPARRERLLYDSDREADGRAAEASASKPVFQRVLQTEVGGRLWEVRFTARKDTIINRVDAFSPSAVLLGGLLSTLLLAGLFYSLASSRSRAMGIANDITRDLQENRALLNDAQKLSHVGCCQYNPHDGRFVWSEELYRIHGVDPERFVPTYDSAMALVHPEDRAAWQDALAQAMRSGGAFAAEFRIVRPDGSVRDLRTLGEAMPDALGHASSMLWSVLDITEPKRTEDALRGSAQQLTALSRRLVEVQETERRQLSRELHDRVGQNLTALSINLNILRTALSRSGKGEHLPRLDDSSALLESTVDSIENVMSELRPPMLDDYGLLPALHWYAKDFTRRTGIEIDVLGQDQTERAPPDIEITLFRIAQEALTNVAKHAHARHVQIELDHANGHCLMTITDDGIGIDGASAGAARDRPGLGMINMRERTQTVGGRFTVRSARGSGTQIAIEVPANVHTHTHS